MIYMLLYMDSEERDRQQQDSPPSQGCHKYDNNEYENETQARTQVGHQRHL
jgi:hypothetical protein